MFAFFPLFLGEEKTTLRAGFEPAREYPIGFRVQRLNHSAITAPSKLRATYEYSDTHIMFQYNLQLKSYDGVYTF